MKAIEKLEIPLGYHGKESLSMGNAVIVSKINELIEKINELNYEVGVIHEWKIEKEGI